MNWSNNGPVEIHTRLVSKDIPKLEDAAQLLGTYDLRGNEKYTPIVLIPARGCAWWLTVPEGFYALATAHGRNVGQWNPGCHFARPWERISHLVSKQYVVFDSPIKACPTADNVMVEIDVSVVFHIDGDHGDDPIYEFVYHLGPEKLEKMLVAYQEEAVRTMARMKKYSDIYDLMDTELDDEEDQAEEKGDEEEEVHVQMQLENTKRVMNNRLNRYGVQVFSITITNVHLPAQFRDQMENATTFESLNINQQARQRYDVLVIENEEEQNRARQKLQELKAQHMAENRRKLAEESRKTDLYKAETDKLESEIQEKQKAAVMRINADSQLKVAKLNNEKDQIVEKIRAEAMAESRVIVSEMKAKMLIQEAEAKRSVAENDARRLTVEAEAEKLAAKKLRARREFELKVAQLRTLRQLAANKKLSLSGSNNDNVVAQLLSAKNAGAVMGLNVNA